MYDHARDSRCISNTKYTLLRKVNHNTCYPFDAISVCEFIRQRFDGWSNNKANPNWGAKGKCFFYKLMSLLR